MALKILTKHIIENNINSPLSKEETDDIENNVFRFITLLTSEVAKLEDFNGLFQVRRIIKAGSFYERTKNGLPDEFDFLVELDTKFDIEPGCRGNTCSAHVKVPPTMELSARMRHQVFGGYLLSAATFTKYWKAVSEVLQSALLGLNELNNFQGKLGRLTIFTSLQGSGPNTEVNLVWHRNHEEGKDEPFSFFIGIDVSPCIPCPDNILMTWKDQLRITDFNSCDRQSLRPVLVIPSPKHRHSCLLSRYKSAAEQMDHACWKISYAPAEVHNMQQLSENHNLCYRFMKCMCKSKGGYCNSTGQNPSLKTLSSFMLKNATLDHVEKCSNNQSKGIDTSCLKSILQYLSTHAQQKFMPAYFFPKRNLWTSKSAGDVRPPIRILQKLSDFLFKDLDERCEDGVTGETLFFKEVHMMQEEFLHFEFEDYRMDT